MKLFSAVIFFLISSLCSAQQETVIKIQTREGSADLPSYSREGCDYIGIKSLAGKIDFPFKEDKTNESILITGKENNLKITARNPFYAILNKSGKVKRIYQVATSTYPVKGDLYIPLVYSTAILNEILGSDLKYNSSTKLLTSKIELSAGLTSNKEKFNIRDIFVEQKANGTLVKIQSDQIISAYKNEYKNGILSVLMRGVNIDPDAANNIAYTGLIKKIDINNNAGDSEIRFHLGPEYTASEVLRDEETNGLIITIHNKVFRGKDQNKLKDKWNFDVIVLDAGHGGKDAGAIGVNGIKEKEINLAITLALGKLIKQNMPEVKVEYTRDDDNFVELYRRGRIANEKDGKLFISLHCNATADRSGNASGFEVYLLRPGRTQEAINIAERENSVIEFEEDPKRYQQLTDENFILVSMAHASYMKYSEKFAEYLDNHFQDANGIESRGVKQAGFYVLVGASMPSVLIESGFISNKKDAAYLITKKGQEETAEKILQSIQVFKTYYESSF